MSGSISASVPLRLGLGLVAAAALTFSSCAHKPRTLADLEPAPASVAAAPPPASVAAAPPARVTPAASNGPLPPRLALDVPALADQVRPAVVNITSTHEIRSPAHTGEESSDPFEFFFHRHPRGEGPPGHGLRETALGSGFIIDPAGFVVTNNHVIDEATSVRVHLADDRDFNADVVGRDPKLDLALIKLRGAHDLPVARLGSSETLRVGDSVLAVGNPFGLGNTVTLGIVSAKARSIGAGPFDDFIQTDASINPGNSGGPLFNVRGEVVGINTAMAAGANGIGFAIPVDALREVLPQLRSVGHVERGRLGLTFQPLTPELAGALGSSATTGALVAEVEPGGPAGRAGLRPGDIVVAVNGEPVRHAEELPWKIARHAPGTRVTLTYVRRGERREAKATLGNLADEDKPAKSEAQPPPDARPPGRLGACGLAGSDDPDGGVHIDSVLGHCLATDLDPGDVIVEIDGARVDNLEALLAALAQKKPGSTSLLRIRRSDGTQFAALPIPAR